MTRPLVSQDPLAPLFLPAAPAGLPLHYRSGIVLSWQPQLGTNQIQVGSSTISNVPALDSVDLSGIRSGDVVSMRYTVDDDGVATYVVDGRILAPDAPAAGGGRLSDVVYFSIALDAAASGSFTFEKGDYPGIRAIEIECVGGAGAAGGAPATSGSQVSLGRGGGGGGYARRFVRAEVLPSSVDVTVGRGGAGVSGSTGNAGSNTEFGSNGDPYFCRGFFGSAGGTLLIGSTASGVMTIADNGGGGLLGVDTLYVPRYGDVFVAGSTAGPGQIIGGTVVWQSLHGGAAGGPFATTNGAFSNTTPTDGSPGLAWGSGAMGNNNGTGASARTGAQGAAGICIVRVYT